MLAEVGLDRSSPASRRSEMYSGISVSSTSPSPISSGYSSSSSSFSAFEISKQNLANSSLLSVSARFNRLSMKSSLSSSIALPSAVFLRREALRLSGSWIRSTMSRSRRGDFFWLSACSLLVVGLAVFTGEEEPEEEEEEEKEEEGKEA